MSEAIGLGFVGATLRAIQAEQRTLRDENKLIRLELGRLARQLASREELLQVLTVVTDRSDNFEARLEARFDQLSAQIGRSTLLTAC